MRVGHGRSLVQGDYWNLWRGRAAAQWHSIGVGSENYQRSVLGSSARFGEVRSGRREIFLRRQGLLARLGWNLATRRLTGKLIVAVKHNSLPRLCGLEGRLRSAWLVRRVAGRMDRRGAVVNERRFVSVLVILAVFFLARDAVESA